MSLKAHHTNWYHGSFNADLEYLLKVAENNPLRLHSTNTDYLDVGTDSKGRSVIGYGYDLFANRLHSDTDLTAVGVVLTEAQKTALRNLTATGGIPAELQGLALPSEAAATDLLWKAIDARVPTFNAFLANLKINIVLPESRERAVLFSMWYQGQAEYFGTPDKPANMTQALIDGNRAEVWYEIRYGSAAVKPNSNGVLEALNGNGVVVRRFAESECFGLYNYGEAPNNAEEAASLYQMYTTHRDRILQYEATFGNVNGVAGSKADLIAQANTDYNTPLHLNVYVETLENTLHPAAESIMSTYLNEYGIAHTFNPLDIQMASEAVSELKGENLPLRTGSADDLLIGRDQPDQQPPLLQSTSRDRLIGGQGNDVLIGLGGDDYLDGGEGDDTMVGGEGIDTYVIDDNDRIIDTGRNNIIWEGKLIAGVFKEIKDNPGTYTFISDDKNYFLAFHSPGQLTLSAEDSITFVNQTSAAGFTNHDFGITLQEDPDLVYDWTFTAASLNYEAYAIKGGSQDGKQWYWYAYGDANTGDTNTFFADAIPSLTISGNSGNDYLYGLNRADKITGGSGNDMISGEWGYLENGTYYNIPGPSEGDQLDGGIGTDLILGSRAGDTILGGEGNDFLSALDGDDVVRGDAGNDAVTGGSHNDILSGGAGDDILFGDGYLVFSGATVADLPAFGVQYTFAANGYPSGYTTTRFSIATDAEVGGDDILTGGAGRDWLDGGLGADMLDGGSESDSLFGGADNDSLFGGAGNDWLAGGTGNDIMVGGLGDGPI